MESITDTYFGGKGSEGTYQTIINQISPCEVFYSCFLGHCRVSQHLQRPPRVYGFDLDETVIRRWQQVGWMKAERQDAIAFLRNFSENPTERACLFCDPPYPWETRKSPSRYKHELSPYQHDELLRALLRIDTHSSHVQILLCTLPNKKYEDALSTWKRISYQNMTRGGVVEEHLYVNRPTTGALQDYRYVGADFTERQRIKRKVNRWVKGLQRLPATERNAILSEIKRQYL